MSLSVTILGCGSSGGVPRPALGWGACDPDNPKNRRRRCSILVEQTGPDGKTSVLVDTSPDLREQLLDANVSKLDGVLFTHEHADHTHGIDDLRGLFIKHRRRIDAYLDEPTSRSMHARFGYCFMTPPGSEYPPILSEHRIRPGEPVTIDGRRRRRNGVAGAAGPRRHSVARLPVRRRSLHGRPGRACRMKAPRR